MKLNSTFYLFILLFILTSVDNYSQQMKSDKVDSLIVESVKEDIWMPFMESYRDLDIKKFTSLYSPEVTRISIDLNKIESGAEYFENINSFFESIKNMKLQMNITFSIVSSATTKNIVYQTGYYTIGLRKSDKEVYRSSGYSQFSVILIKENDSWKINLDSDKQVKLTEEEFIESGIIYKLE